MGRHSTSFLLDCSFRTPDGLTPGCRRFRELFIGKEVIGREIKEGITCGFVPEYPDPRPNAKLQVGREEYIHDTQTDMWYHCCEFRPRWGKFTVDVDQQYRPDPELKTAASQVFTIWSGEGMNEEKDEPIGPLMQCNLLENLKHKMDMNGMREVYSKVASGALGATVNALLGPAGEISGEKCDSDEAVALRRFQGNAKDPSPLAMAITGHCVDIGSYGNPTPNGKTYHVFELGMRPPDERVLAAAVAYTSSGYGKLLRPRRQVARRWPRQEAFL